MMKSAAVLALPLMLVGLVLAAIAILSTNSAGAAVAPELRIELACKDLTASAGIPGETQTCRVRVQNRNGVDPGVITISHDSPFESNGGTYAKRSSGTIGAIDCPGGDVVCTVAGLDKGGDGVVMYLSYTRDSTVEVPRSSVACVTYAGLAEPLCTNREQRSLP